MQPSTSARLGASVPGTTRTMNERGQPPPFETLPSWEVKSGRDKSVAAVAPVSGRPTVSG